MSDAQLKITITALNNASKELASLKKDLGGVDKAAKDAEKGTKSFGDSWAGVLTGLNQGAQLIQTVVNGMKQVYQVAREGAELQYLETRFDNLADSIGTVSDALLRDMRDATRGMVSDTELMASAADFMALGLAKSHDEVVRLTRVAGALGMNMNQLVLTLTNQTTMRFDALGVSVDGFKEKVKALEDAGMSADEAFKEAFLQQAEEQIKKVGNAADSTIGSFKQLEAVVKNGTDSMKKNIAEVLAPAIEQLADKLIKERNSVDNLKRAMELGIITQEEYNRLASHEGMRRYGDEIGEATKKVTELEAAMDTSAEDMIEYAIAAAKAGDEQEHIARTAEEAKKALDNMGQVLGFITGAMDKYGVEVAEGSYLHEELTSRLSGLTEKQQGAKTAAEELTLAYQNGTIDMFQYADAANALVDAFEDGILTAQELAGMLDKLPRDVRTDYYITVHGYQQVQQMLSSQYGGYNPGPGEGGPQAVGGSVYGGNPYTWQEYGYKGELFVPSSNGFVLSRADAERMLNSAMRGGGGELDAKVIARAVASAVSGALNAKDTKQNPVNNYNLNMTTSGNPQDMVTAFEIMRAIGV